MATTVLYPGNTAHACVKPSVWIRFFPSLTDFAFLLPIWFLFAVLRGSRTLLFDGDPGWHIRTGDWILQHHQIPYSDIFSFTKMGQPWFAWEWGWDVLASLIHNRWGLPGIVFVNAIVIGFISVFLFRLVRRHTTNHVLALVVSCAAIVGSSIHWLARPHLLSWLFVLAFVDVMDRVEDGDERLLWRLPVLTLLWVNLHGSFFIGITFLFTYAVVEGLQLITSAGSRLTFAQFRKPRSYLICGLLCCAASLINPYGWRLHQHLIAYLSDSKQLADISEFGSLDFNHVLARFCEFFLVLGPCVASWLIRKRKWSQAVIILIWIHLSLCIVRNVPIYLFIAAAPTAAFLEDCLNRFSGSATSEVFRAAIVSVKNFGSDLNAFEDIRRFHPISVAGAVIVAVLVGVTSRTAIQTTDFDAKDFPVRAVSVIEGDKSDRVFTHSGWGDYLIYKLYPRFRVFVDGRSDFYGADFSKKWIDARNGGYDWRSELSQYSINTVLLRTTDPLASIIKQSPEWRLVFDDGVAIIFRKRDTMLSVPPERAQAVHQFSSGLRAGERTCNLQCLQVVNYYR